MTYFEAVDYCADALPDGYVAVPDTEDEATFIKKLVFYHFTINLDHFLPYEKLLVFILVNLYQFNSFLTILY